METGKRTGPSFWGGKGGALQGAGRRCRLFSVAFSGTRESTGKFIAAGGGNGSNEVKVRRENFAHFSTECCDQEGGSGGGGGAISHKVGWVIIGRSHSSAAFQILAAASYTQNIQGYLMHACAPSLPFPLQ